MDPQFDRFPSLQPIEFIEFDFAPDRFEVWQAGKMVNQGITFGRIEARKRNTSQGELMSISLSSLNVSKYLSSTQNFDQFIANGDRLMYVTIPERFNVSSTALNILQFTIGSTRDWKEFSTTDAYCCSLFLLNGRLKKVTFSVPEPETLIEFYSD